MVSQSKSHVGMEYKICMVCMDKYSTGVILLDRRLKESLEQETITGWGLCPEHEKLHKEGYLCLVAIDISKSDPKDGKVTLDNAYRTGRIAHISRSIVKELLGIEPSERPFIWVEESLINRLQEMQDAQNKEMGE